MSLQLDPLIDKFKQAAMKLISRDWARSFFGNMSILIDDDYEDLPVKDTFTAGVEVRSLDGDFLIATRTFFTMDDVVNTPEKALGLYKIDREQLSLIWGEGPPTSDITSHLLAYSTGKGRALVHCHMDSVTALSGMIPLPEGYGWVDKMEPGSIELANATMTAMRSNHTVIWKGHGAISLGDDPKICIERLVYLDEYLADHPGGI